LKRWGKLSDEYKTLHVILELFIAWCGVFFGIWVFPFGDMAKYMIDLFTIVVFVMLGLAYFTYKNKIDWSKHRSLWRKLFFGFTIGLTLVQAGMSFILFVGFWEVFSINGVNVVTYRDLISLLFAISGILLVVVTIRMIKNRHKYLKPK
jgi:magnesium-transporting ATPase (P-type)